MKDIRACYKTPHCAGSKSLANVSHEEVYVIYYTYIDLDVIRIIIYKFVIFLCCEFWQVLTSGKPPTRAKVYIDTHTKKGGGHPNDEVKERVVWFLHLILKYICVLVNLFKINT
jgi:hypothetical protein